MVGIVDNKCTQKTYKLLMDAKEHNGIVVCKEPTTMRKKAYDYGIVGIDFVTHNDYIQYVCRPHDSFFTNREIYIDELEDFLNELTFNKVKGYTISKD